MKIPVYKRYKEVFDKLKKKIDCGDVVLSEVIMSPSGFPTILQVLFKYDNEEEMSEKEKLLTAEGKNYKIFYYEKSGGLGYFFLRYFKNYLMHLLTDPKLEYVKKYGKLPLKIINKKYLTRIPELRYIDTKKDIYFIGVRAKHKMALYYYDALEMIYRNAYIDSFDFFMTFEEDENRPI